MAPGKAALRVSYVIPEPIHQPPRLQLPRLGVDRHGSTTPLLFPAQNDGAGGPPAPLTVTNTPNGHPRHRLGVNSLALDTSTQLSGSATPEGILYSGGRDGMIIAHELGIPHKKRAHMAAANPHRWQTLVGFHNPHNEEEPGPVGIEEIPYINAWEMDMNRFEPDHSASFRQSVQTHSDWINDILLCNYNRTLVSASSDGTLKAWYPHDQELSSNPATIGRHGDYVRCVVNPRQHNWIASGGFDRTIKIWDVMSGKLEPTHTLTHSDSSSTKASVYALATDPAGSIIASGSPERVVRLWDPRAGSRHSGGKLVGHTDNIRSILISDDARYLLTASADASIKLWSLASAQRCLYTFSYHTDSVWSLYSSHPSLEIFYSGDRSGSVCRVDMERCADVSEGECIFLCKETPSSDGGNGSEGINKLVVMDDNLVWTATASSTIKRWRVPGQRTGRMGDLAIPGFEADHESPTMTPTHGRPSVSPFGGFSQDAQPSAILTRRHDSFTSKEAWNRSESPGSLSDPPSRRAESPSLFPVRSPKRSSHLPYTVAIPGPFASDASLHSPIAQWASPPPGTGADSTLYGIPFQSLIRLASPSDAYSLGSPILTRGRDPDVATLYSAASIRSVPGPLRHFSALRTPDEIAKAQNLHPTLRQSLTTHESVSAAAILAGASYHTTRFTNGPQEEVEDVARVAYENREIAINAIPLYEKPDDVIEGTRGIVRSIVLNDRWHALTVDTRGQVGVWDIIRGQCLGVFEREDVEAMMHGSSMGGREHDERKWSPREALEAVRERIEGESVVSSWCTVDNSIGNLMVHVQYPQCFDGEIYADEAGYGSERFFDEDARLNIGKWILGNLFAPFVQLQIQTISPGRAVSPTALSMSTTTPGTISLASPSSGRAYRSPNPGYLANEVPQHVRSISEVTVSRPTPRIVAALATGPLTPAILPDLPHNGVIRGFAEDQSRPLDGPLTPIPQSPLPSPVLNAGSPTPKGLPGQCQTFDDGDYFSARNQGNEKEKEKGDGGEASLGVTLSATPSSPAPLTSGSSSGGFIGRLRAFGKTSGINAHLKKSTSETNEQEGPTLGSTTGDQEKISEVKPPSPTALSILLSRPLNRPPSSDVPPLSLSPLTNIILCEPCREAASGWRSIYQGLHGMQASEEDVISLEREVPEWILEFLLANMVNGIVGGGGVGHTQKFSFLVVPWKGAKEEDQQSLPELVTNQNRLTASKHLRVRKILLYVKDKVDSIEAKQAERQAQTEKRSSSRNSRTSRSSRDGPPSHANQQSPPEPPGLPPPASTLHTVHTGPTSHAQHSQAKSSSRTQRPSSSSSTKSGVTRNRRSSSTKSLIDGKEMTPARRAEQLYELLCHGILIPNDMTLATVKQFMWRQGGELVMEYRRKQSRRSPA